MAEPECRESAFRHHESIRAQASKDPGVQLVGRIRIVRIHQHQFHVPLVERCDLARPLA